MSLTITVGADDIRIACPFATEEWQGRDRHGHGPAEPDDWPCYGDGKLTVGDVLRWLVGRVAGVVAENDF